MEIAIRKPYCLLEKVSRCAFKYIDLIDNLKINYEKRKKKSFFLIIFYIFHKNGIKTFLKLSINKYSKGLVN